jgi:hypothetical protein
MLISQKYMISGLRILKWVSLITLFLACIRLLHHRIVTYLLVPNPIKDEIIFVAKYDFLLNNGWHDSIVFGTSPVFNVLVFVFNLIVGDPFISMKALNIFSMLGIVGLWTYYLFADLKISFRYRALSVISLVYLTVTYNSFFSACNDSLFLLLISLGIYSLLRAFKNFRLSVFLASAAWFALALGTRELLVFYIPGILLVLIFLFLYQSIIIKYSIYYFLVFGLLTVILYYPSLAENGNLEFLDKNEGIYEGYWQEKNYLQLMQNTSGLSLADVESFKASNPDVILPTSYLEGIFMNPVLTLKNFIRQLTLINSAVVWKLGLLYLAFLIFVFSSLRRKEFGGQEVVIFLVFLLYAMAFSVLPINRVEFRWFILFPILFFVAAIYRLYQIGDRFPWTEYVVYLNFLVIGIVNFLLIGIW